jgi:hypothetical protein
MRSFPAFLMAALFLSTAAPASDEPKVTRILHLQDIESREAVTLLRSEAQVRQIAEVPDLGLLIVKGVADRVDRCESLLRERNAIAKTADPHEVETPGSTNAGPTETRVFRIDGIDRKAAVVVLRAIYQIRELSELPEENAISVTAPAAKLKRTEALLGTLGVLESAGP